MIFKTFEPTQSTAAGGGIPTVRIRSEGRLILNAAGKRQFESTEYVQLLWDETTERFGILPTTDTDPLRVRIVHAPSQSVITSKEFVQAHPLPYGQRLPLEREGDMWVASTAGFTGTLAVD
jgi:hypothetical protein